MGNNKTKRILFLANHFITLYSFRKELIKELIDEGHEVFLSFPEDENNYFGQMGCHIIPTAIDRRGVNPRKDLKLIMEYRRIIKQTHPDIIFSYTIKPNIYGSLANARKYKQICNITGTGATFLNKNLLSEICKILYRCSVKKSYKVYFQNSGDKDFFVENKLVGNNYEVIPGSGCNLGEHTYCAMPDDGITRFIFIGRVMELKGIEEYLEAAQAVKEKYEDVSFIIAGWNEDEKYKEIISKYQEKGVVEYIGFRKDIKEWIAKCNCTVLPSHGGEGVPNVLLESAAIGRACIGSKINGTKDVIEDGITGYLFQTGNAEDLADKMIKFHLLKLEQKERMGQAGRNKVEREFDRNIIIQKYLDEVSSV